MITLWIVIFFVDSNEVSFLQISSSNEVSFLQMSSYDFQPDSDGEVLLILGIFATDDVFLVLSI